MNGDGRELDSHPEDDKTGYSAGFVQAALHLCCAGRSGRTVPRQKEPTLVRKPVYRPSMGSCQENDEPLEEVNAEEQKVHDPTKLDLVKPLKDAIVVKNGSVVMRCKVRGNYDASYWLKDGEPLLPSTRVSYEEQGSQHSIKITNISNADMGLYLFSCSNVKKVITTYANLFVAPEHGLHTYGGVIYMQPVPRRSLIVLQQLPTSQMRVGHTIIIQATFKKAILSCTWTKSNRFLPPSKRVRFSSDSHTVRMKILNALLRDTGIYHVIVHTMHGISSSFANVIVYDDSPEQTVYFNGKVIPSIEECFPEELEILENDECRIVCRANINQNTVITWMRNDVDYELARDSSVTCDEYGNSYFGIQFKRAEKNQSAEYSFTVTDVDTEASEKTTCKVSVTGSSMDAPEPPNLIRPLEPAVAIVGARAVFECSFDISSQHNYCHTLWNVGRCQLARSCAIASVLSYGSEFLLYIKSVEPDMSGEVTCELRFGHPNENPVLLKVTSGHLTVVPEDFIRHKMSTCTYTEGARRYHDEDIAHVYGSRVNTSNVRNLTIPINGEVLEIVYCKLEPTGFYYSNLQTIYEGLRPVIKVQDLREENNGEINTIHVVTVIWIPVPNIWYKAELCQRDGSFVSLGISSKAFVVITNPVLERILRIKITAIVPLGTISECNFIINAPPAEGPPEARGPDNSLQPLDQFRQTFDSTGQSVGSGAFGNVELVGKRHTNQLYAAKYIRTRVEKKRYTALREYEIMKTLRHDKIVQLYFAFISRDQMVLVMEYLWGGELFDRIVHEETLEESDVVPYVRQILEGLQYLHGKNIVHLDIKPENIMCISPNSTRVKIIDLGLARVLTPNMVFKAIYGTRDYVAPEVLAYDPLTDACDLWSAGVVTFMLLSGTMPFAGESWYMRSVSIAKARYNYSDPAFENISDLAKNFVDSLLRVTPDKRLTATQALNHPWVKEGPPDYVASTRMFLARENLRNYLKNFRRNWQRLGLVVRAAHRLRSHSAAAYRAGEGPVAADTAAIDEEPEHAQLEEASDSEVNAPST